MAVIRGTVPVATGITHMEASRPFNYRLGDFFSVPDVKLGPAQVGGLTGLGGDHLHFYFNGKPLSNPAALVLHKDDSVAIGYGPHSGFPHKPAVRAAVLRAVSERVGHASAIYYAA